MLLNGYVEDFLSTTDLQLVSYVSEKVTELLRKILSG